MWRRVGPAVLIQKPEFIMVLIQGNNDVINQRFDILYCHGNPSNKMRSFSCMRKKCGRTEDK